MFYRLYPKGDRSWIWAAQDFSEGEIVQEKFAIRFKTSDIANDFKEAFLQAQVFFFITTFCPVVYFKILLSTKKCFSFHSTTSVIYILLV